MTRTIRPNLFHLVDILCQFLITDRWQNILELNWSEQVRSRARIIGFTVDESSRYLMLLFCKLVSKIYWK